MIEETKIAWLAGLFDGEGSVAVRILKSNRRVCTQMFLRMTSEATIRVAAGIMESLCERQIVLHKEYPSEPNRQPIFSFTVGSKTSLLRIFERLLPYMVTKRLEVRLLIFSCRATMAEGYKARELDYAIERMMKRLKRNCGETRAEVIALLGQVTPSQAAHGAQMSIWGSAAEGLEIRSVNEASNKRIHERPASHPQRSIFAEDDEMIQSSEETPSEGINSPREVH